MPATATRDFATVDTAAKCLRELGITDGRDGRSFEFDGSDSFTQGRDYFGQGERILVSAHVDYPCDSRMARMRLTRMVGE